MLATLNSIYQLRSNRLIGFRPKVQIEVRFGNFLLKTASHTADLRSALELRYQVFHREFNGSTRTFGLDVDSFDAGSDHLIVIDERKNQVVGACRISCSKHTDKFYSAQEFILTRLLSKSGHKVDVGRLCLRPEYREGLVTSLLWRGVRDYMIQTGSRWMLSLGTVPCAEPRKAALLYRYFSDQGRIQPDSFAPPTLAFTMANLNFWIPRFSESLTEEEVAEAKALITPLFKSVLTMGATIGGEPAFDRQFQCLDFLAIVDREKV
jgi:putative hemolysin